MVKFWEHLKLKVKNFIGTPEQTKVLLNTIVYDTFKTIKIEIIDWINTYVPKRTGALREDLINYINSNWIYNKDITVLDLISSLPYAMTIIGDPKHTGTWYEHSGAFAYDPTGGMVYLDDPQAEKYWYDLITQWVLKEWNF